MGGSCWPLIGSASARTRQPAQPASESDVSKRDLGVGIVLAARGTHIRIREGRTWYSGLGYGAKMRGDLARASARPSTPGLLEIFAWH